MESRETFVLPSSSISLPSSLLPPPEFDDDSFDISTVGDDLDDLHEANDDEEQELQLEQQQNQQQRHVLQDSMLSTEDDELVEDDEDDSDFGLSDTSIAFLPDPAYKRDLPQNMYVVRQMFSMLLLFGLFGLLFLIHQSVD
jgi:hypothetical protein